MIRSMTGFGSATEALDGVTLAVTARGVNSRGLKVVVKGPPGSEEWEPALRELVGARVSRGRIDLTLAVQEDTAARAARELDEERVRELLAGLERVQAEFGVSGRVDLATLSRFGPIFREASPVSAAEIGYEPVARAAGAALDGLIEMRSREGERLEEDLRERLGGLRDGLAAIEALAPERLERERERLRASVAQLSERVEVDDDRIAREIALLADRWDIGEELVRTAAHIAAFEEYLEAPADEPVGKRLGFLVQELQREVNTLGAKANDTRISRRVVEMRNEIEKLREQVENVE